MSLSLCCAIIVCLIGVIVLLGYKFLKFNYMNRKIFLMNKRQKIVVEWLSNTGVNFMSALIELEQDYDSVPNEVCQSFKVLSDREKVEVVNKSSANILETVTS